MRKNQSRERNSNWRGGRSVASNGYVLLRVGVDHHLADVRGYAYEHRVVAEQMLSRRLLPGEEVHHRDENPRNNEPSNLEVVTKQQHRALHVDAFTNDIHELILTSPWTRNHIAEFFDCESRRVGWALQRLRSKGLARLLGGGSWAGIAA